MRIIRQNIIVFAFGLNALAMGSAFLGILGPIAAAVLHQGGSFLVLVNAMRLLWFGDDWRLTGPGRGLVAAGRAIGRWDERSRSRSHGDGSASALEGASRHSGFSRRWSPM